MQKQTQAAAGTSMSTHTSSENTATTAPPTPRELIAKSEADACGAHLWGAVRHAEQADNVGGEERAHAWLRMLTHVRRAPTIYPPATLLALHQRAVDRLPKAELRKVPAYARIWTGLAEALAHEDVNEARTTFKYMKIERIGLECAHFYRSWSDLERRCGNLTKAESILAQGRRLHAEPADILDEPIDATSEATATLDQDTTSSRTLPLRTRASDGSGGGGDKASDDKHLTARLSSVLMTRAGREVLSRMSQSGAPGHGPAQRVPLTPLQSLATAPGTPLAPPPETPQRRTQTEFTTPLPNATSLRTPSTITTKYRWAQLSPSPEKEPRPLPNKVRFSIPKEPDNAKVPSIPEKPKLEPLDEDKVRTKSNSMMTPDTASSVEVIAAAAAVVAPPPISQAVSESTTAPTFSCTKTAPAVAPKTPSASRTSSTSKAAASTSSGLHRIMVNNVGYLILEMVGKGGSGKVYKVVAPTKTIYAVKRVRLDPDDLPALEAIRNEIALLRKLRGMNAIIELIDSQEDLEHDVIWMVFEYGDTDLARLLRKQNGKPLGINYLRLYWQQMLEAVDTIHNERIVHSDLKPANFIIVKGQLKLIDFGIAKAIGHDTTHIVRNSQIGTLNYMAPEAILGTENGVAPSSQMDASSYKLGRSSDIWSLGCILYQMAVGRSPFHELGFVQKVAAITNANYAIRFPSSENVHPHVLEVLRLCLQRDPSKRPSMRALLEHRLIRDRPQVSNSRPMISKSRVQTLLLQPEIIDAVRRQLQFSDEIVIHLPLLLQKQDRDDDDDDEHHRHGPGT